MAIPFQSRRFILNAAASAIKPKLRASMAEFLVKQLVIQSCLWAWSNEGRVYLKAFHESYHALAFFWIR